MSFSRSGSIFSHVFQDGGGGYGTPPTCLSLLHQSSCMLLPGFVLKYPVASFGGHEEHPGHCNPTGHLHCTPDTQLQSFLLCAAMAFVFLCY